jgi:diguanylate cyclase (GGDEF)-like protein
VITTPACAAIASALGVDDLLVLEREGSSLKLIGGAGRGAGWAGTVQARIDEEELVQRARDRGRPLRVSHRSPARIFGPYWSTNAALIPVGDEHLVIAGTPFPIRAGDGELVRYATEAVAAIDGVPSAKLLADELEVVHAVRQLMEYRADSVRDTARHVADVAAAALSCDVAAVLVRAAGGLVVEVAGDTLDCADPRVCAEMVKLGRRVVAGPLLEQDVDDKGILGRGVGLVARYSLGIGSPQNQLGVLVVGHSAERPRGFTSLCQRVGRSLADAAEVLLAQATAREELREERDRFAREARTDELTGLANRVAWNEAIEAESARRARYRRPVVVLSADVDHLKAINDAHGHQAGDELLVAAANVLREELRNTDLVARVGGDEFGALLPETDAATMQAITMRINEACAEWRGSVPEVRLSMSVGWAVPGPFGDLREALHSADGQMYLAKRGR